MVFSEFVPFPGITDGVSEFPPVSAERGMWQSKGVEVEQGAGRSGGGAQPRGPHTLLGAVGSALG